jgi:hypothetical protein
MLYEYREERCYSRGTRLYCSSTYPVQIPSLSVQNIRNTRSFHDRLTSWIQVSPYWGHLLNPLKISVDGRRQVKEGFLSLETDMDCVWVYNQCYKHVYNLEENETHTYLGEVLASGVETFIFKHTRSSDAKIDQIDTKYGWDAKIVQGEGLQKSD